MKKCTVIMLVAFFTMLGVAASSDAATSAAPPPASSPTPQSEIMWGEYDQVVSAYQNDAAQHAMALYWQAKTHGKEMNQELTKEHVEAINRDLERINVHFPHIMERVSAEERKALETPYKAIPGHYQKANTYAQALREEVAKTDPDPERVMDLSAGIYQELQGVETASTEVWDYRKEQGGEQSPGYVPEFVEEMRNRPIKEGM